MWMGRARDGRLALLSLALAFIAAVSCLTAIMLATKRTDRQVDLNESTVAAMFRDLSSSRAALFLAAEYTNQTELGPISWTVHQNIQVNVTLGHDNTRIWMQEPGLYLLFVQAVYKVQAETMTRLRLQVNLHSPKNETDQYTAIFHSHESAEEEDVVLNKYILLRLVEDGVSVHSSHRYLMDYDRDPVSSFLSLIKVSD